MMRFIVACAMLIAVVTGVAYAQCEPSAPIRLALERSYLRDDPNLTTAERDARRLKILDEELAHYPHDVYLLRQRIALEKGRDRQIAWAEAQRRKYPGQAVYAMLYAVALEGRDTPEAIRLLESLTARRPASAQVYLELVSVYGSGKFKNGAQAQQALTAFLSVCPAPLAASALSSITRRATPEQLVATAAAVRARLSGRTDSVLRNSWLELWSMEFKARPPAEHAAVRQQIAQDLAVFEKSADRNELRSLSFLQDGYQNLNDAAQVERVEDAIVTRYPASEEAKSIIQGRWRKAHPYPAGADTAQQEVYWRASLAAARDWHNRWPDDAMILLTVFDALAALPDTTPGQIVASVDEFRTAYKRNPNFRRQPPLQFALAGAYLKHKVRLDQVPELVDEGYQEVMEREAGRNADDRGDDETRKSGESSLLYYRLERARILLDYAAAANQPAKAREIDADLASIQLPDPAWKSMLLARRARAAEVEGRSLDALMLFRAALDARTRPPAIGTADEVTEAIDRLWKALGGTSATRGLLADKPKPTEASDSRWERPRNPLPSFALPDLQGKSWKLADLKGKAVLINVWATWCGPCRMEHPEFQTLYDQLKSRSDIVVLSLNVDEERGKVAPYMQEQKYTFPVLLDSGVVDAVVPLLSIPRNWFISPEGKLEWEQVGYGPDPKWRESMIAKLEELLKRPR